MTMFQDADVISTYTDAQAVEDGVLVDLEALGASVDFHGARVNRMTGHLFETFRPYLIDGETFVKGTTESGQPLRQGEVWALQAALKTKLRYATDSAQPGEQQDWLYVLPGGGDDGPIWLVRNELDGWTVMFASDY